MVPMDLMPEPMQLPDQMGHRLDDPMQQMQMPILQDAFIHGPIEDQNEQGDLEPLLA